MIAFLSVACGGGGDDEGGGNNPPAATETTDSSGDVGSDGVTGETWATEIPDNLKGMWLYADSGNTIQLTADLKLDYDVMEENILKVREKVSRNEERFRYLIRKV